eukprot:Hpha_TRINITY_DN9958_c0_g1::TRINITY_DN9958_c0_g1_i1::g.140599::m.140599/K03512/POLL; DNA polymerase lambda
MAGGGAVEALALMFPDSVDEGEEGADAPARAMPAISPGNEEAGPGTPPTRKRARQSPEAGLQSSPPRPSAPSPVSVTTPTATVTVRGGDTKSAARSPPVPSPGRRTHHSAEVLSLPPTAPPATSRGSPHQCFSGAKVVVVVGGKELGLVRGRTVAEVVRKHGGQVRSHVRGATHVVTGFSSRRLLQQELGTSDLGACECVGPEWVTSCVRAAQLLPPGQFRIRDDVPSIAPAATAPALALADSEPVAGRTVRFAPAPAPALPPQSTMPADPARRAGFVPVFFGEPGGKTPSGPVSTALKRRRQDSPKPEAEGVLRFPPEQPDGGPGEEVVEVKLPTSHPAVVPKGGYVTPHANKRHLAYIDRKKPFACQRPSLLKEADRGECTDEGIAELSPERSREDAERRVNPNQHIVDELERLQKIYAGTGDHWRKYSYGRALAIIRRWRGPIRCKADLLKVQGIGESIASKIEEIIATGTSAKLQHLEGSEEVQVVRRLTQVWGIGSSTALKLYRNGVKTVADLHERSAELSRAQQIGLRFLDEIQERIPRKEVTAIENIVKSAALGLNPNLDVQVCGSYRR